jgi:hypothetical protein
MAKIVNSVDTIVMQILATTVNVYRLTMADIDAFVLTAQMVIIVKSMYLMNVFRHHANKMLVVSTNSVILSAFVHHVTLAKLARFTIRITTKIQHQMKSIISSNNVIIAVAQGREEMENVTRNATRSSVISMEMIVRLEKNRGKIAQHRLSVGKCLPMAFVMKSATHSSVSLMEEIAKRNFNLAIPPLRITARSTMRMDFVIMAATMKNAIGMDWIVSISKQQSYLKASFQSHSSWTLKRLRKIQLHSCAIWDTLCERL